MRRGEGGGSKEKRGKERKKRGRGGGRGEEEAVGEEREEERRKSNDGNVFFLPNAIKQELGIDWPVDKDGQQLSGMHACCHIPLIPKDSEV